MTANPAEVIESSDVALLSRGKLLILKVNIKCDFGLKRVFDMIGTCGQMRNKGLNL